MAKVTSTVHHKYEVRGEPPYGHLFAVVEWNEGHQPGIRVYAANGALSISQVSALNDVLGQAVQLAKLGE